MDPLCDESILGPPEEWIAECEADPAGFQADALAGLSCEQMEEAVCPQVAPVCPGCPQADPNDFNTGSACGADADCRAGDLQAACIPAVDPNTGEDTAWAGGYCTGLACGDCSANGVCVQLAEDGTTGCLARCVGAADCRPGYECVDLSPDGQGINACVPAQP